MSYTAPQYADTKEQAVLALASVIADEDKTALGNGSVNKALDVLADVLAQQDVTVPQTNAGAILALAQYVGGGGASELSYATFNLVDNTTSDKTYYISIPYVFHNVKTGEDSMDAGGIKGVVKPGEIKTVLFNGAVVGKVISLNDTTITVQGSGSVTASGSGKTANFSISGAEGGTLTIS